MKAISSFPTLAASVVALLAIPRSVLAGQWPSLQVDPDTISPCVMWEDNANDLVCEEVREFWNITAEEFSLWNPSVGLDCKPWRVQSYCVVPLERLPTTTSSEVPTATTTFTSSTSTLGPSPTSWSTLGCYTDENPKYPALDELISEEGGDNNLTIAKCQDSCYKAAFIFAGVKAGNECWCSDSVLGDLATNSTDCDTPCSGNKTEICGGSKCLNVFEPDDSFWDEVPTGTETASPTNTETKTESDSATATPNLASSL
ncbi:hypothetical protein ACO1O0_007950 [Amphichorda felina]